VSVYIVTGKLGGGKTLAAVSKIDECIRRGGRVATNLDLRLRFLPGLSSKSRAARVVRLPDRPLSSDLSALGYGIEGVRNDAEAKAAYDESQFGLIVLDECGTWLNAREWQDADRRALLDLLLHIRKKLWHVYLIIQDISMLDKQVRKALAEHVVYCRNLSNFKIPGLSFITEGLGFGPAKLPKSHLAIVKYGDQPTSITVDRWFYGGAEYYRSYDTTQVFRQEEMPASYSILPPGYTWRWPKSKRGWTFLMRITKIYLKRTPKLLLAGWAALFGALVSWLLFGRVHEGHSPSPSATATQTSSTNAPSPSEESYRGWFIRSFESYTLDGQNIWSYTLDNGKGETVDTTTLTLAGGVKATPAGPCRLIVTTAHSKAILSCRAVDDERITPAEPG